MQPEAITQRSADPYRDLDVIDSRGPRTNQACIGSLALVSVIAQWWWITPLLALQLAAGLALGRRWCLPCLLWFEVLQPRLGEGSVEDARAPRFANIIGLLVLSLATATFLLGFTTAGYALTALVAALALLAATTGLCVGCIMYRGLARLRGIRPGASSQLDPTGLGMTTLFADGDIVLFTHPLCSECHRLEADLRGGTATVHTINVRQNPIVAKRYGIAITPTAVMVAADGSVQQRLA